MRLGVMLTGGVELTMDQQAELQGLVNNPDVPATVGTRARIVLWHAEDRQKKEIAGLAGVSRPTVDLWLGRYRARGVAGVVGGPRGAASGGGPGAGPGVDPGPDSGGLPHQPTGRNRAVALVVAGDGRVHHPHRGCVGLPPLRGDTVAEQWDQATPAGHVQA